VVFPPLVEGGAGFENVQPATDLGTPGEEGIDDDLTAIG